MTENELRDEALNLTEEIETILVSYEQAISKIEEESFIKFEMQALALKNKLIEDVSISEDDLPARYLEQLEILRKNIAEETKQILDNYLQKIEGHTRSAGE